MARRELSGTHRIALWVSFAICARARHDRIRKIERSHPCRRMLLPRRPLRGGGCVFLCAELPLFELPPDHRFRFQAVRRGRVQPAPPRQGRGPADDLRGRHHHDVHCARCGSLLYSRVREGKWVHVAMGTLVDAPTIRPTAHIFVGSKAPWHEITDDLPQHRGHVGVPSESRPGRIWRRTANVLARLTKGSSACRRRCLRDPHHKRRRWILLRLSLRV